MGRVAVADAPDHRAARRGRGVAERALEVLGVRQPRRIDAVELEQDVTRERHGGRIEHGARRVNPGPACYLEPMDRGELEGIALAYLERWASSAEGLRRHLLKRCEDVELVDALVARYVEARLVDDRSFAEHRALRGIQRGASPAAIAAELEAKGVSAQVARDAMSALGDDAERDACRRYMARRRIGPFRRDPADRAANRDRDLAALARRGFSEALAEALVDEDLDR